MAISQGQSAFAGSGRFTPSGGQEQAQATFSGAGAFTVVDATPLTVPKVLSYLNAFPGTAFLQHLSGQRSDVQSYLYPGAAQPYSRVPTVLSIANAFPGLPFPQHGSGLLPITQSYLYPGAVQPPLRHIWQGQVNFAGAGSFSASGTGPSAPTVPASASFNGAGSFTAGVVELVAASESFTGAGQFIVSGGQEQAQITFAASGSFTALATTPQQFGQVNYNGAGQFLVSGGQEQAQVLFAGAGSLAESAALLEAASASFNGVGSFLALAGTSQQFGQTTYNGAGQFIISGGQEQAQVSFAGIGSFLVDASVGKPGSAVSYNGAGAFLPTAPLMLPASTSFAGAGSFLFGEMLAEVSGANFAGTGRFVAGESLQLSASAYFAGAGLFTALGNVPTALPISAFFFGTGGFIVNGTVVSPIAPPVLANGRWNLIMPPLDSLVVGFGFSRPILTPILNEQGFTIYFSARNLGRNARIMALQSPSGIVTRTTVFYNVGVTGLAVLTEFQVVAHVTPLNELDEPGVWEIWVENADGIRMTDSGFFTVGRLN